MSIDDLARDLASGAVSRRTALRRLAAGALGLGLAAAPSALAEELERGNCPKSRRCGKKCCAKGAKCKNGKCKCKSGLKKCGKKCVDLTSSAENCGTCGNACDEGRACIDSQCTQCSVAAECPDPGFDCQRATCVDGFCGSVQAPEGTLCFNDEGLCDNGGTCIVSICGNDVLEDGEQCDGSSLGGATCESLGFTGGTLACDGNCRYNTSNCTIPEGCGNGIVEGIEQCDDGGNVNGDGCSASCQIEPGFVCQGTAPSVCAPVCGDGIIVAPEQCDGSNLGGKTCATFGFFGGGTLACSSTCQFDTSGCIA
jgi:cysteine-rich repeat protein